MIDDILRHFLHLFVCSVDVYGCMLAGEFRGFVGYRRLHTGQDDRFCTNQTGKTALLTQLCVIACISADADGRSGDSR